MPIAGNRKITTGGSASLIQKFRSGASTVLWLPGQTDAYSSTIKDWSGNANHGTISGATWTRLPRGLWCLTFDGVDDIVTITDAASLQSIFVAGGTIAMWVNRTSGGGLKYARICEKTDDVEDNTGWSFYGEGVQTGTYGINWIHGFSTSRGRWNTTNSICTFDKWEFVGVTYSSALTTNDPIFYLNGVAQAVTEGETPVGTQATSAGKNLIFAEFPYDHSAEWKGSWILAYLEKRIWSASEFLNIFNRTRHLFGV